MNQENTTPPLIAELQHAIKAQRKTIEVLMDTVEAHASRGASSLELLSENIHLEKIVQRKTEKMQRQGAELEKALAELKQTQAQLLHANKLESVGQLASGIAHEINTPTQFIGTNIEFLKETFSKIATLLHGITGKIAALSAGEVPATVAHDIHAMMEQIELDYLLEEIPIAINQSEEGVQRITSIVQAMKEFSHPSSKQMEPHDINRIIQTTITVTRNEWKYCAEIQTKLAKRLPMVQCLADELGQVMLNIIVNAAQAIMEKQMKTNNTDKGHISISTEQDGDAVIIRIGDDGCGMPPHVQSKVFDPFFTTKEIGKGTGQGLAIAHSVISQKHGGTLSVVSAEGKGTEFTIRLPVDQAEAKSPG